MSETKLKPCPFCGGVARIDSKRADSTPTNGTWSSEARVWRYRCEASCCNMHWKFSRDAAIAAWNRRTPEAA